MNLTALQHSAFLQSLGWAIANSLWQSAILWIVYHLINASYKNATSKFKNLLSTTLLFAIFVWFTQTFFHRYFLFQDQINLKTIVAEDAFTNTYIINAGWKVLLNKVLNELPYLSVAYLMLLIIFSIRLINSYRNINFIKNNGLQKPPVEWRLFTNKVAMHIGINKKIKLWFSEHIDVPATLGFLKPVILIPLATVNQLSPDQLEAIILHELSHIQRNDYFINLFISIIETILFFNPFVVLLSKIIKRERENCCDDFVIQYKYDPHSYACALLSLEQSRITNLRLALAATSGKKQLLVRIKRIMETKSSNTNLNYGQKLLSLMLVTGIITSIAWLSPQKKENTSETSKKSTLVLAKPVWDLKLKEEVSASQPPAKISAVKIKKNPKPVKLSNTFYEEDKVITSNADQKKSFFNFDDSKPGLNKITDERNTFALSGETPLPPASPATFPGNHTPSSYFQSAELLKELSKKIDVKKLQADFEKANFSFSFDWNKWHDEISTTLQKIQLDDAMVQRYKKLTSGEIEKLIQAEMKNLKARSSRTRVAPGSLPRQNTVSTNLNKKFFVLIDSIASLSAAVLDKSDQNCFKKIPQQVINKLRTPVKNYKEAARFYQYQNLTKSESLKNETNLLQGQKNKVYNYTYDVNDGVVILNGKKLINLPETKSTPLLQLKRSVTINTEGNNIIEIRIEN